MVSGLDDLNAQLLVFAINNALKSEAFNPSGARLTRKGDAKAVAQLVADMKAGNVHTLIMNVCKTILRMFLFHVFFHMC